jgi:hypothetical protein
MAILSNNSISTGCWTGSPVLNSNSSKIFNTSNARIPKTVAVVKRFPVRNGSIGGIRPEQKSQLQKKAEFYILPGRPSHISKHPFSRLIDHEKISINENAKGANIKFPRR